MLTSAVSNKSTPSGKSTSSTYALLSISGTSQSTMDIVWKIFNEVFYSGDMKCTQQWIISYAYGDRSQDISPSLQALAMLLLVVDVVLRGIAQVFLCNHPVSGIFICIGLAFTSGVMLGYSILTTLLATGAALFVATAPLPDVLSGLCGYDGALVGCACYWFLAEDYSLSAAVLLSLLSGVVHVACANILGIWSLPTFTFAFNIVTILILLAIQNDILSLDFREDSPATTTSFSPRWTDMSFMFVIDASIRGVGQFMFADTTIGSAFVIAGIAIASRQGAFAATLGATVGWIVTLYILKVKNVIAIRSGLFGYNCAGTCASLAGGVFYSKFDLQTVVVGIVGACLCCLLNVGIVGALSPLPCLTFPFITTTWIILVTRTKHLSNKDMEHHKKSDDVVDEDEDLSFPKSDKPDSYENVGANEESICQEMDGDVMLISVNEANLNDH